MIICFFDIAEVFVRVNDDKVSHGVGGVCKNF